MPHHSNGILTLLAAATKYNMDAVQSFIRAEVRHKKLFSSGFTSEAFRLYAVAYSKGLVPEVATTARDTLSCPLTFEDLGYSLRSFEGGALRDLADFRLRSMNNFSSNLKSFSGCLNGPSKIWVGCPASKGGNNARSLPPWLESLYSGRQAIVARSFTETIPTSAQLHDKYMKALQRHVKKEDCKFCMKVHILEGETYCVNLKHISTKAWGIPVPTSGERPGTLIPV
jgi:hypothetical protein